MHRFGGGRKGEKGTSLFQRPYCMCPLEIQVSFISYHLFPHIADSTKATLIPSHTSSSTAIMTLKKNNTWLQKKFLGLQHNSQNKQSAIFKTSSATSISLHNQTKQKARARQGNTVQGKGAYWGKTLVGHEGKRRASKKKYTSAH